MKNNLSNQYISNIFSEHPIASWSLDDNFHYLSIDRNYATSESIPIYAEQQVDGTYEDFNDTTEFITNLIINPSFEINSTGWTGSSMSLSISTSNPAFDSKSLLASTTSTGSGQYAEHQAMNVTAGLSYSFSTSVRLSTGNQVNSTVQAVAVFTDGTTQNIFSSNLPRGSWIRIGGVFTVPSGQTTVKIRIRNATSFTSGGQ